jgi:hypothetical protein
MAAEINDKTSKTRSIDVGNRLKVLLEDRNSCAVWRAAVAFGYALSMIELG